MTPQNLKRKKDEHPEIGKRRKTIRKAQTRRNNFSISKQSELERNQKNANLLSNVGVNERARVGLREIFLRQEKDNYGVWKKGGKGKSLGEDNGEGARVT